MRKCRGFVTEKPIRMFSSVSLCLNVQSSDIPDDTDVSNYDENVGSSDNHENLIFADSAAVNTANVSAISDYGPVVSISQHTELGQFLSRPTLINTRSWSTSDGVGPLSGSAFYVWHALLNDAVIKRKIENYAFMKATLCVKMLINGTKFHYGSLRASYEPLAEAYPKRFDWNSAALGLDVAQRIAYDQTPGAYLDPSDNTGVEIRVPMLYNREFVPLKSASDVQDLGRLRWIVYQPLRVANTGATTTLTISTYAWLEDISLSGSTNALVLQAKDEYDDAGGPVSAPALSVAKVARSLTNVPVIGRFAKATEIGASAVGGIAKLFGFTDVPNIQDVPPAALLAAPHIASSQVSVPYQPLTLQPKSQISIDPSLHGIKQDDELAIKNIVSTNCFFAASNWTTSDAVGTCLFSVRINPAVCWSGDIWTGSPLTLKGHCIQHTPLSFVSQFFEHWRGDLIYTIKLVKSKFHSGRLRVTWDPMSSDGSVIPPANTVYNTIIDLSDKDEYEVRVPWFYQTNYNRIADVMTNIWSNTSGTNTINPIFDNGTLNISVLTNLAAPLSSADVGILVYVKAGDNFEVNNPADQNVTSLFQVQSKDVIDFENPNNPTAGPVMKHFGAPINSLRELARRSRLMDRVPCPPSTANAGFRFAKVATPLPLCRGYDPNGQSTANGIIATTSTFPYNFTSTSFIPLLISAYAGVFGSLNYTFVIDPGTNTLAYDCYVRRNNTSKPVASTVGSIQGELTNSDSLSEQRRELCRFGEVDNGAAISSCLVNNTLQINMPYLNNYSFFSTDPYRQLESSAPARFPDGNERISLEYIAWIKQFTSQDSSKRLTLATYVAAGPDFQVLQWVFPATGFVYAVSPTAA